MIRTTEMVPVGSIQTHPRNANLGDVGAIYQSLEYHKAKQDATSGQYRAIVVSEETGNIIAGNHTYLAAQELGETEVLAHLIPNLTPEDEVRILTGDNQLARLASTDDHLLVELLTELQENTDVGLLATGFDGDDLDALIADLSDDPYYTNIVQSPTYEPTEDAPPPVSDLFDPSKTVELETAIAAADLPDDIRTFLHAAAQRHTVLRFDRIAEYYAHAPADIQRLFEDSVLVIIDFDRAVEDGYVRMDSHLTDLFEEEHPDA